MPDDGVYSAGTGRPLRVDSTCGTDSGRVGLRLHLQRNRRHNTCSTHRSTTLGVDTVTDSNRFVSDPDHEAIMMRRRILLALTMSGMASMMACGGQTSQDSNAGTGANATTVLTGTDHNTPATGGESTTLVNIVTGGSDAGSTGVGGKGGSLAYATGGLSANTGGWLNLGGADAGLIQTLASSTGGAQSCAGCQGGMCQGCT